MYRNTRFGELMKGLSRGAFERIVSNYQADKYSKGLSCWDQCVAMIYAQLSGVRSLRELEAGFNSQSQHHYHLGTRTIKRSTLADANARRRVDVYADTFSLLLSQVSRTLRRELTDARYLLDSSPIPLKGLGYDDWTLDNRNSRTQGLKLHMMIESGSQLPCFAEMTAANINDIDKGREVPIEAGATYVFDKGYCDYNWWFEIHQQGAYFVTRFKKNAGIKIVETRPIPADAQESILEDSVVTFKNRRPGGQRVNAYHGTGLRKVVVDRPDKQTPLVIATNDMKSPALMIAQAYKERWGIELYFKWLKQNLKIKQFLGRSENAVKIQIYTALIAYILVALFRETYAVGQTLKICLVTLRSGLFQRPEVEQCVAKRRRKHQEDFQRIQRAFCL